MDWDGHEDFGDLEIRDNGELSEEEEGEEVVGLDGGNVRGGRGEDVPWKLAESFENVPEFKASNLFEDLKDFSVKNKWEAGHADVESLVCKFSRRTNYKKCPRLMKIEYCSTSQAVNVFDNQCEHNHEIDLTNTRGAGKKYMWTPQQTEIMLPLVKARATAKVILRELESKGATDRHGVFPTLLQLNTKKNYMFKTQVMEELVICDTADLRILIEERSEVPEDPHQPFVCAYKIDDSDPSGKPRFTVTFSTKHMLSLINRFTNMYIVYVELAVFYL